MLHHSLLEPLLRIRWSELNVIRIHTFLSIIPVGLIGNTTYYQEKFPNAIRRLTPTGIAEAEKGHHLKLLYHYALTVDVCVSAFLQPIGSLLPLLGINFNPSVTLWPKAKEKEGKRVNC